MLISEKHRFIFIHIYKNAGTSITAALLPFATNIWLYRANSILRKYGISIPHYVDPHPYEGHITASELISRIGQSTFRTYFSFAIVRNPWDWQVSFYTFMLRNTHHHQHELTKNFRNFDEYIKWRCTEELRYQKDFVFSPDGTKLVDFIGRYEQLEDDFRSICSRIGISTHLPRLNVSKMKPYRDYYNKETIELVQRTFAPDIELFGYSF